MYSHGVTYWGILFYQENCHFRDSSLLILLYIIVLESVSYSIKRIVSMAISANNSRSMAISAESLLFYQIIDAWLFLHNYGSIKFQGREIILET